MLGHLGTRVSALLDGQLGREEEDRAWAHVHVCHACRDLVEREGWVKTRLAGLGQGEPSTPSGLKGSLMDRLGDVAPSGPTQSRGVDPASYDWALWSSAPGDLYLALGGFGRPRRAIGMAAIGGGAVGAAMMGVLALGAAPADAPTVDRRVPATSILQPAPVTVVGSHRRAAGP